MQDRYTLYESAQDLLICELDKLIQKNEITGATLDYIDKLVDIIKDLDEVMDNEDARTEGNYALRSNSRTYYNRGNSYRDGFNMASSYARRSSSARMENNGYSRGSGKEEMLDHLYAALDASANDDERNRIQRMITELEKAK